MNDHCRSYGRILVTLEWYPHRFGRRKKGIKMRMSFSNDHDVELYVRVKTRTVVNQNRVESPHERPTSTERFLEPNRPSEINAVFVCTYLFYRNNVLTTVPVDMHVVAPLRVPVTSIFTVQYSQQFYESHCNPDNCRRSKKQSSCRTSSKGRESRGIHHSATMASALYSTVFFFYRSYRRYLLSH